MISLQDEEFDMTGQSKPQRLWSAVWRITLFFVIWGVLYSLFILPVMQSESFASKYGETMVQLYANITGSITIMVALWIAMKYFDKRNLTSIGLQKSTSLRHLTYGTALGMGMMGLSVAGLWFAGSADINDGVALMGSSLVAAAVSMALNTVIQEVIFRGYILQTIRSLFDTRIALAISTILFVLFHGGAAFSGIITAGNLLLAGALLGLAYIYSNQLWLALWIHFGWNFLQGPVFGLTVTGQELSSQPKLVSLTGPNWLTGGDFGLEGGLVATLATSLGILFLIFLNKRKAFTSKDNCPPSHEHKVNL